ncbi:hypothetical protein FACS1894190_17290 [Spirochaetia bacterium]|nr:hypothetical protein FACS1894190_17290 [Spirochaetia bacterium]
MKINKYSLFLLILFVALNGCAPKQRATRAGQKFAAPQNIAVDIDSYKLEDDRQVYVYWSQTQSERGYALNPNSAYFR